MLKKLGKLTKVKQDQEGLDVPPGQYLTTKFPVLSFGPTPSIDLEEWRFRVFGLVEEEVSFDWEEFTNLGKVTLDAEFHCVTQWSRLENTWEGVPFSALTNAIAPKPEAKYVMAHCYGGYTTNVGLDVLQDVDVLFAYNHDGSPLEPDHGGTNATRCPQALRMEERKMGQRPRVHGRRRAGILGGPGLPHGRGSLEGTAFLGATSLGKGTGYRARHREGPPRRREGPSFFLKGEGALSSALRDPSLLSCQYLGWNGCGAPA